MVIIRTARLVGFLAGWSAWISIVSVIPVEAEASVQYMSSWPWAWAHHLYVHAANGQGELSVPGLCICAVLVVVYFLVNFWSVKVFAGTNSAITFFKLIVPAAHRHRADVQRFSSGEFPSRRARRRSTSEISPRYSPRSRPAASCSATTVFRAR